MFSVDLTIRDCDGHVVIALCGELDIADAAGVAAGRVAAPAVSARPCDRSCGLAGSVRPGSEWGAAGERQSCCWPSTWPSACRGHCVRRAAGIAARASGSNRQSRRPLPPPSRWAMVGREPPLIAGRGYFGVVPLNVAPDLGDTVESREEPSDERLWASMSVRLPCLGPEGPSPSPSPRSCLRCAGRLLLGCVSRPASQRCWTARERKLLTRTRGCR